MKYFVLTYLVFFLLSVQQIDAASSYVLPYPSEMPGSRFYKVNQVWEKLMKYWHFGSFAAFSYNLQRADKYLVEAKTLFEYNQYKLGFDALEKSNSYFEKVPLALLEARREGKIITEKEKILKNASLKHREVLEDLKTSTPAEFTWTPEFFPAQKLDIGNLITKSIALRHAIYEKASNN